MKGEFQRKNFVAKCTKQESKRPGISHEICIVMVPKLKHAKCLSTEIIELILFSDFEQSIFVCL